MSFDFRILIILGLLAGVAAGIAVERYVLATRDAAGTDAGVDLDHARKHLDPTYVCPMHPESVSNEPGSCPICGMDLVAREAPDEDEAEADGSPVVRISPVVINNLGVKTVTVERRTLVRKIETPGFIQQIAKDKYTTYQAPAKGRVVKFHAVPGQWLETGDPMVDFELDDLVKVQERHLELLAQVNVETGNIDAAQDGAKSGTVTGEAETGQQETKAEPVQTPAFTRALMLRAGMSDAQIERLEKTGETSPVITLHASHAGEMMDRKVAEGDTVDANGFLFALGLMRVTVLANAFQRDASWVKPGQPVDVVLPHDSQQVWKGMVSQGAVSIDTSSQNIGVKLTFTAPGDKVKSGMYVVGNIYGQVSKDTLSVPREAVIYTQDEQRVIVALGDGRFKPVMVQTGISTGSEVEILDGLEEGEHVVVSAQFMIDSESSLQASFQRMGGE